MTENKIEQLRDNRTYDDILESFAYELNDKGANINYAKLSEKEKLELMQILLEQCKKHMRPFVKHVLGYDWFWFHDVWFNNFLKYDINCNIFARGGGKSFYWSRMLPAYMSFLLNNYKCVISSYNEPATFDFIKDTRRDFEDNELLQAKVSQDKSMDWNKGNLDLINKSFIRGISITSQIRRLHVNYFCADDIINDEQKLSPTAIKNKIYATILPTLQRRRGKFNIVGTRFSEDDIYSMFKEKALKDKAYHYCEIRVELDEKNREVYLVHSTEEGEIERYKDSGITDLYDYEGLLSLKINEPNLFAREYECKVVSEDDVPFPLSKLNECKDPNLSYDLIGDPRHTYAAGLDSANSTKEGSDSTVLMTGRLDIDNNFIISNIFEENKSETPERLEKLKRKLGDFQNPRVLAEQNSMGLTNIQMLNSEGHRLEPFFMDRPKKVDITDYASVQVKLGKVKLPYKTLKDQELTNKLIHQLTGVRSKSTKGGHASYDGTTAHDDLYVGFILLLKYLGGGISKPTKILSFKRSEFR